MIDENGNEVATAQAAEAPVDQQQASEGNGQNGIQKRIDELTARFHAAEGKAQALEAAYAQVIAQQAQRSAAPQVDEADAAMQQLEGQFGAEAGAAMRKTLAAFEAKLAKQIGQTQAILQNQEAVRSIDSLVQDKGLKDPRVGTRAKELIAAWRSNGLQLSPQDAVTFAAGELAMNPQQPRQVDGRYAPQDPVMTYTGAPPAAVPRGQGRPPANFDSMSVDQQLQWFDANGVGDKPF